MERFIKNDLLKRVSAQDWVSPKDMLPWSAQDWQKFIVFYKSKDSGEDTINCGCEIVTWKDWNFDNKTYKDIPNNYPCHNGKNIITYQFDWDWDVLECQEYFEVVAWKEIPEVATPDGEIINLSNPCDERYNCDKEYIQKTFFDQFKD